MNAPSLMTQEKAPSEHIPSSAFAPVAASESATDLTIDQPTDIEPKVALDPAPAKQPVYQVAVAPAAKPPRAKKTGNIETEIQAACRAVWGAYVTAYTTRYGVAPIRNAKVNAGIKSFVSRLPHDEAPAVAAYYVNSVNDAFIVKNGHSTGLMLQNAETYRTLWATGQSMTSTRAKQIDQSQSNYDAAGEAKAILRARRAARAAQEDGAPSC